MSMNNVLPFWVLELEAKEERLSPKDFLVWLDIEGKRWIPEEVRRTAADRARKRLENAV